MGLSFTEALARNAVSKHGQKTRAGRTPPRLLRERSGRNSASKGFVSKPEFGLYFVACLRVIFLDRTASRV